MESKKEKGVYAENYKLRIKIEELKSEIDSLKDKLSQTLNIKLRDKVEELESEIDSLKDDLSKNFSYASKKDKDGYELNGERESLLRAFYRDEVEENKTRILFQKRYYGWSIADDGRIYNRRDGGYGSKVVETLEAREVREELERELDSLKKDKEAQEELERE